MNHHPAHRKTTLAIAIAACGVVAAGAVGLMQLSRHTPEKAHKPGSMLLAPMIGVIDSCVLLQDGVVAQGTHDTLDTCKGPKGSAAALVESTLSELQPRRSTLGPYQLGYTLPVPLLQLFRPAADGWAIDNDTVGRLVRTVRDTERPLILYLFSTHFATDAPLEKALSLDPTNLAQTRDGPLTPGRYYDSVINNWTFANTQTELTSRRVQATQALLKEICRLPAQDIGKIKGVTLLGELHHLFPDFEAGMGFNTPYRATDYSPPSVAGFRQFLQREFASIGQLNRVLGANYASFDEVLPPSRDIRTEPLQRFTEHIDSFAQGSLPIAGWAYMKQSEGSTTPAWVHVYRNGVFVGKTLVNQGRQDVLAAKPEFGDANTGWRLDMDFRHLRTGLYRIDVFLEQKPGQLTPLGTRSIALMDRLQSAPQALPQNPLPAATPADASLQAHIDMPTDQSAYYYNPLVPLWHAFRQKQVVDYLEFFDGVVNQSCLASIPHYTHQIIPFTNPSWDANKYAIQASLRPMGSIRLGVSLYGDATYGKTFSQWYGKTAHNGYGVTEFHPLKAMDPSAVQRMLGQHAAQGAEFLSFFLEPRWQGKRVPRNHNLFSLDPSNTQFGSDRLYQSMQKSMAASQP
ncbi:hypothetical protein CLU85_4049 [Acidovorax sp. 69]|uniref:hypothetical protein n=1 Tax=Acidovorax sp. 69 TaxID=2035202 RepID=UPI000C249495|nr:hypothetical protein [Acidovorax sp. 69]PJI99207.1 hypothetical protein CLU85_4049 [Acidovorax sp. 69]